jgi:hypothetical protein
MITTKCVLSFVTTVIALVFSWFALVILGQGSVWTWFLDIWLPVLGLFWGFDIWLYPMMPWHFWEDKDARNGIFTGLAVSLTVAFTYMGIEYLAR